VSFESALNTGKKLSVFICVIGKLISLNVLIVSVTVGSTSFSHSMKISLLCSLSIFFLPIDNKIFSKILCMLLSLNEYPMKTIGYSIKNDNNFEVRYRFVSSKCL